MNYEAAVFDLDGTLVYTAPQFRYFLVGRILKELGVNSSNEQIDRFWFEAGRDRRIREWFGLAPELFWETYEKYDTIPLRNEFPCYTRPYEDVNFLEELTKTDLKLGIVTGASAHIASYEIGLLGKEYFDAVIIARGSNGVKEKPHPQGLEECLDLLVVEASKAIYVGNSDEDIETAKNAGVFDVLLDRGEHRFPQAKPSLIIRSLYDLQPILLP